MGGKKGGSLQGLLGPRSQRRHLGFFPLALGSPLVEERALQQMHWEPLDLVATAEETVAIHSTSAELISPPPRDL